VAYVFFSSSDGTQKVGIIPGSNQCFSCSDEKTQWEAALEAGLGSSYVRPEERALWGIYRAPPPPNRLAEKLDAVFPDKDAASAPAGK
jgi:hypothetical protein